MNVKFCGRRMTVVVAEGTDPNVLSSAGLDTRRRRVVKQVQSRNGEPSHTIITGQERFSLICPASGGL